MILTKVNVVCGMFTIVGSSRSWWPASFSRWGMRFHFLHEDLSERSMLAGKSADFVRHSSTPYTEIEHVRVHSVLGYQDGPIAPVWQAEEFFLDRRGLRPITYNKNDAWRGTLPTSQINWPNIAILPPMVALRVQRNTTSSQGRRFFVYHRVIPMVDFKTLFMNVDKYRTCLPMMGSDLEIRDCFDRLYPRCLTLTAWQNFMGASYPKEVVLSCREKFWKTYGVIGYDHPGLNYTSRTFKI